MVLAVVAGFFSLPQSMRKPIRRKPVKLVVPFPAGSATDQIARVVGQQLQGRSAQPFVVENKPGAQGTIAADRGRAGAAPDGYTLMVDHQHAAGGERQPVQEAQLRPGEGLRARRAPRHDLLHADGAARFSGEELKEFLALCESKSRQALRRLRLGRLAGLAGDAALDGQDRLRRRALQGPAASDHRRARRLDQLHLRRSRQRARADEGRQAARHRRDLGEALAARARGARHRRGAAGLRADRLVRADGAGGHAAPRSSRACTTSRRRRWRSPRSPQRFATLGTDVAPMDPGAARRLHPAPRSPSGRSMAKEAGIQPQ